MYVQLRVRRGPGRLEVLSPLEQDDEVTNRVPPAIRARPSSEAHMQVWLPEVGVSCAGGRLRVTARA